MNLFHARTAMRKSLHPSNPVVITAQNVYTVSMWTTIQATDKQTAVAF